MYHFLCSLTFYVFNRFKAVIPHLRGHSNSMYAKFSEKLASLTP